MKRQTRRETSNGGFQSDARAAAKTVSRSLLCVAIAGTLSPFVSAAEVSGRTAGSLEEVVVTARRRVEMAQDVPLAITAMSPEMLEDKSIFQFSDLGKNIPGFSVSSNSGSTNSPVVALRGQRPSETLLTLDPAVPLYFAEIVMTPVYGTNLAMYDLANVQVLKGPQGTLFGRNSTGGAVLLSPQTPANEFEGYLKGTVGNYNLYKAEGAVSVPVNDVFTFRLAGQSTDRDGYQSNVAQNDTACSDCLWSEDSYGLRLVASLDTGTFRNLSTLSYDQDDSVGRSPVAVGFNPETGLGQLYDMIWNGALGRSNPFFAGLGVPTEAAVDDAIARQSRRSPFKVEVEAMPDQRIENWFFANATEFDLSDELTLKNIFGYRKLEFSELPETDGISQRLFGAITIDSPTVPDDVGLPGRRTVESEQFSNEVQLIGYAFDQRLEWVAGVYWYKMEGSEKFLSNNLGRNPAWPAGPSPVPDPDLDTLWAFAQNGLYLSSSEGSVLNEAYAVFGEGTFDIDDQWSATLGLRQTWDKRELTAKNRGTPFTDPTLSPQCSMTDEAGNFLPNDGCVRTVDETFSSPTWRVAVNYSPEHAQLLYGSISTGYRSGGFNMRGTNNVTLAPFDEETVLNYEIGHKADWNAGVLGNVRTALALYWQEYSDIQKTQGVIVDSQFVTNTVNAAEAVIRGAELDITAAPSDRWLFSLSYSYIDAYYKEWGLPRDVGGAVIVFDNSSSPFVYVPEHSLTATAKYTLPLDASVGEVSLLASVYWQSEMDSHPQPQHFGSFGFSDDVVQVMRNAQKLDAYDIWNFRLSWRGVMGSSFDADLFVNNAFDEEYVIGGLNVIDSLGWAADTYGEPRTFGGSVRWNF